MNNQQSNPKMTNQVPSSSQMSSAPELYSVQAAKTNSALSAIFRDQTPPTVARNSGCSKGSRVEKNHKSSPLTRSSSRIGMDVSSSSVSYANRPHTASRMKDRHGKALTDTRPSLVVRLPMAGSTKSLPIPPSNPAPNEALLSSSRDMIAPTAAPKNTYQRASQLLSSGGSIAPSAASSAIPFALHVNTCRQAVLLSSGSAPTTIPRFRIISDAREAIEQLIRARSSARISTQESMYDQEPEQSAFPMYDRQPEQSSHQESMYDRQSAFSQRPAPYQRRRLPEGLRRSYQQRVYQHREHPQTQPFVQPSAFQQPRHANEDSKRWHQSLWDDDGMM
jgi:hypothetical protein